MTTPTKGRGALTDQVQQKAKELLGREITVRELRLMPYIQNVMMNHQRLEVQHLNGEERAVLRIWRDEGHTEGGATGFGLTRHFWNIVNELMWLAYVCREHYDYAAEPRGDLYRDLDQLVEDIHQAEQSGDKEFLSDAYRRRDQLQTVITLHEDSDILGLARKYGVV